jgi:hypothetical protein
LPGIVRSTSARVRGLGQAWSRFAAGPLWRMLDSPSSDSQYGRNDLRTPICTVAVYANGVELCATRFLHIVPQKKPTIQFLVDHNRRPCHWFVEGYRVQGEEPSRGERVMRSALRGWRKRFDREKRLRQTLPRRELTCAPNTDPLTSLLHIRSTMASQNARCADARSCPLMHSRVNQVMVSRPRPSALFRPILSLIPRYGLHVAGKHWLGIGGQCAECAARAQVLEGCGLGRANMCGAIRRVRLQSWLHPFMGRSIPASRRVS